MVLLWSLTVYQVHNFTLVTYCVWVLTFQESQVGFLEGWFVRATIINFVNLEKKNIQCQVIYGMCTVIIHSSKGTSSSGRFCLFRRRPPLLLVCKCGLPLCSISWSTLPKSQVSYKFNYKFNLVSRTVKTKRFICHHDGLISIDVLRGVTVKMGRGDFRLQQILYRVSSETKGVELICSRWHCKKYNFLWKTDVSEPWTSLNLFYTREFNGPLLLNVNYLRRFNVD